MPTTWPAAQGGVVNPPVPIVAGSAVVLTGEWVEAARQAVLIAVRARRLNGMPTSTAYVALARALTEAMSARGQSDVRAFEELQDYPQVEPNVTVEDAARQLELSQRQTRRIAPKLGGKIVGGRWLLDQAAIDEHTKGQKWKEIS